MKKLLLLSGLTLSGLTAVAAEVPAPTQLPGAYIYAMSANGQWAVSQNQTSLTIFNLATGNSEVFENDDNLMYSVGIGKCISDNGILVGTTDYNNAEYYKNGEWYTLDTPDDATATNLANAITPDGKRICGSIGVSDVVLDGDALMQAPVIWEADENGDYGMPVRLPYPELDFTNRVPQYVTAVDISDDGKKIIGQVMNATGFISYPILYTEDENGKWSYELVHYDLLNPSNVEFPPLPGDGPAAPNYEDYMTSGELDAYDEAVEEYYDSDYNIPYPNVKDFMSEEELAEYEADVEAYQKKYDEWNAMFNAWYEVLDECINAAPGYEFNSVRISPDGKTYGCTIQKSDSNDPFGWGSAEYYVWVFDTDSDKITKYEQLKDFNLSYLGNGVALASTSLGEAASNSFVLKDGKYEDMYTWMRGQNPEYADWMDKNMRYTYEDYEVDEEGNVNEVVKEDVLMTGHAVGTPDLSYVALSVTNVWDFTTEADAVVFDVKTGTGVESVRPASEENVIYDLSGRKLNKVSAPGIYIVNGEKKVVR